MGARPSQFAKFRNTLGPILNGRYQRYAQKCCVLTDDNVDDEGVRSRGSVLVKNVMPRATSLSLSQQMGDEIVSANSASSERATHLMRKVPTSISKLGRPVVDIFHGEELDRKIRGVFGSHYRIQWLDCYRSLPATDVSSSWLWHSDNVPAEALKVMLHLTDAGVDQGATQFMTMGDTLAYYKAGYRGPTSKRVEDLQSFAGAHDLPHHDAQAGDVMLFLNNALHKAIPPQKEYRDVLTYLLLPTPIPWDEQLEQDGIETVESNPGGYPRMPWQAQAA